MQENYILHNDFWRFSYSVFFVIANFLAAFAARQRAFPPPTPPPLAFLCRGVDVYMTKLRQKLSDCESFEIKTVHGLGYKAVIK